jgi:two-component system, cell cycle sensor histidine kinase and response regulator CckA
MSYSAQERGPNVDRSRRLSEPPEDESRLQSVFRATPIGITLHLDRVIHAVNDSMCELTGYSEREIVGHSARLFYGSDEEFERVGRALYAPTKREGCTSVEALFRRKDGAAISVVLTTALIDQRDQGAGFVVTVQDITARKRNEAENARLQEQLQQAMKMEAVGRLAGGVAHDFNNLLTSIMGNAELAQIDIEPDSVLAERLQEITRAAQSAATLTHQLLAFSRRQIIEPRVLDLNELVRRLNKMLGRLIGDDVQLATVLSEELGSVRVDPGQFEQVLVNLSVNARDAMPDGGRLIIETSNVDLDAEYCAAHAETPPGRYVLLAVSDTGQGMSPEVQRRIFEPFFTTKPQGKGTGLGLATIFGIVKQAGGAIEVYSEPGLGTTFKIYLPRAEQAPEALATEPQPDIPVGGSETILLAEDSERVLTFAQALLSKLGYKVLFAGSGIAALDAAIQYSGPIDLLITDVVMPSMNGRELATKLAKVHPETRVLFTSGYAEDVIVHHGVLDKDIDFISKPYSLRSLAAKVRAVLKSEGRRQ